MSKRVCLGKIAASHGIKGLVKILPFGEDASLIETLGPAYSSADPAQTDTLVITLKNPAGKYLLAAIEGVDDRTSADALRGTELYFDRTLLPEPDEDEFYYDDLIGLQVVEGDTTIGTIKAVQNFGAGDLFEVKPTSGASFYIPYAQAYILTVDLENGKVTAQNTQELREE